MHATDNVNAGVSQQVLKMCGFYVVERYEMRLRLHFRTLLALSLFHIND